MENSIVEEMKTQIPEQEEKEEFRTNSSNSVIINELGLEVMENNVDLTFPDIPKDHGIGQARSKYCYIFLFVLLGTNEGAMLGYSGSLTAIFTERKVPSEQRAMLNLVNLTFMLRMFFAPLADKYYIHKLGKRRSYMIPCKIFAFSAYLISSMFIEDLVAKNEIIHIVAFMLLIGIVMILETNALQGLRMDYFGTEMAASAAAAQTISMLFGFILGLQLFTVLNSERICLEYLGLKSAVLSHLGFFRINALINFAGIFIIFLVPDRTANDGFIPSNTSLSPWKTVKAMMRTKPLWKAILWNFFGPTPTFSMKILSGQYYILKGLKREDLIMLAVVVAPLQVASNIIWIKIIGNSRRMFKLWIVLFIAGFIEFFHVFNHGAFDPSVNYGRTIRTLLLIIILDHFANWFIVQNTFFMSTASQKYTVTYLSSLTSMFAACRAPFFILFTATVDYTSMSLLFGFLLLCQLMFQFFSYRVTIDIDKSEAKEFGAQFDVEIEKIESDTV